MKPVSIYMVTAFQVTGNLCGASTINISLGMPNIRPFVGATLALLLPLPLSAQTDSSLLNLDRMFASSEFTPELLGGVRWLEGEPAYTRLEPDSTSHGARHWCGTMPRTGAARSG